MRTKYTPALQVYSTSKRTDICSIMAIQFQSLGEKLIDTVLKHEECILFDTYTMVFSEAVQKKSTLLQLNLPATA